MAGYIERNKVLDKFIEGDGDDEFTEGYNFAVTEYREKIKAIPSADVQPVKRGKWDFQGYQLFKCTNCKEIFTQNQLEAMQNHIDQEEFTFPNFCPNCGVRMDGDSE